MKIPVTCAGCSRQYDAAYYHVSRWDEMRSRLVMVVVGLTLLAIGGRMLEANHVLEANGKASGTL